MKENSHDEKTLMKHLHVAVGIIRNANDEIFLAQRSATSHMAYRWEFPGGKIEPGECARDALTRELYEETGINVKCATPFGTVNHAYVDFQVTLHFFMVEAWEGEPYGREGQAHRWVNQQDLRAEEFPTANKQIVKQLLKERQKRV